jgi:hypothetical protein
MSQQNSRNQGFSYYFCLMIEESGSGSRAGSGSRSIPLTNESGSGRSKNTWIRWIRIRNTGLQVVAVVVAVGGKPRKKRGDHGGEGGGGMICEAETAAAQEEQAHRHVNGHVAAVGNDVGVVDARAQVAADAQNGEVPRARHHHPLAQHQHADRLLDHRLARQIGDRSLGHGDEFFGERLQGGDGGPVPGAGESEREHKGGPGDDVAVGLVAGLKNPGFFLKPSPVGFFGFLVFLGFFFFFLYGCPEEREFLGFFQFQEYF